MAQDWYKKASVQTALVSGVFFLLATLILQCSPKARLEKEVLNLQNEVQRLETQLSPFRALAIQRFGGSGDEALAKLGSQMRDLQSQLERVASTIRRFDVSVIAELTGDWKSVAPPDLSELIRTASRGTDIRVELKTDDAGMRLLEFTDTSGPRMASGEGGSWILDYTAQAPAGSWVLGVNRDNLQTCGALEMTLFGISRNVTQDGVVCVTRVALTFFVNGIQTYRCEYKPSFKAALTEAHGSPVRVRLSGPVDIQKIP